ncbi:MAG: 50S ribosomal protein L9 [Nitrospira sp.]|nr:50S ribosomal protein L9 [Candidatus Manganitrophaceae bacterium]HIL34733.1 50S ribosomal protein L9 [Candidatus Manganitrophaceae bacterium]
MKLILKEDVVQLGQMGDLVDVADGYARNYLLPQKKATFATTRNVKLFEHEKRVVSDQVRKERFSAEETARKIEALVIRIPVKVGEEGKLFGSVTSKDIGEAVAAGGIGVDKRKILLDKPIKELGIFEIKIKIHNDITAQIKVEVVGMDEVVTEAVEKAAEPTVDEVVSEAADVAGDTAENESVEDTGEEASE